MMRLIDWIAELVWSVPNTQMARFGNGERRLDGLEIAHLTEQDDIGILPQHVLERGGEGLGVGAHFALIHQAAFVRMHELDGILDGYDVDPLGSLLILSTMAARVVDLPLPVAPVTSTRPRDFSQIFGQDRREPELVEAHLGIGNEAEDGAHRAALDMKRLPTEARHLLRW